MVDAKKRIETVDEYIAGFSPDIQEKLQGIRHIIKKAAPLAEETISYQIPTFRLNGILVHIAAFKHHIGFYPTPSAIKTFKKELSAYMISKGSIRIPLDEPIPHDLIRRIVLFKVKENKDKSN